LSRAFVDEDASDRGEPEAPAIKIPVPAGSRNYLTPAGAEALARELGELGAVRDPTGAILRRIEYLEAMSGLAEVVPPPPEAARDRVKFGALVRVREAGAAASWESAPRAERSYRIVGIDEADPERGLIGWPSPVARALIGKRVGERAQAKLPEGSLNLLVLEISYP